MFNFPSVLSVWYTLIRLSTGGNKIEASEKVEIIRATFIPFMSLLESFFFFILLCHILGSLTSVINSKSNRSELIVSCGYWNFWYRALQNVQAHCWTVLYTVPAWIMQLFYIYVNGTAIKFPFAYIIRRWMGCIRTYWTDGEDTYSFIVWDPEYHMSSMYLKVQI